MSGPVLVINAGSSSLKYQLLLPASGEVLAKGLIERIGEQHAEDPVADHGAAIQRVLAALADGGADLGSVVAVGHRVVHGGPDFSDPVVVDDQVVAEQEIRTVMGHFSLCGEGLCIGYDSSDAVSAAYAGDRFEFTGGEIKRVVFDVADDAYIDVEAHLAAVMARD